MTKKSEGPRFSRYPRETRGAMLIEAGLACLARGGMAAFTVDNICREAAVSRGLIKHHFGSKDALLAAVYSTMYDRFTEVLAPPDRPEPDLAGLVEANVAPAVFNAASLKIWLALWGEIANSAELRDAHRQRYQDLLDRVAGAIAAEAGHRGQSVDARAVATMFIALSDGLWLEHGIDAAMLSRDAARTALYAFLERFLGPLDRPPPEPAETA